MAARAPMRLAALLPAVVLAAAAAGAASLEGSRDAAEPGGASEITVSFAHRSREQVSGIQFDLAVDAPPLSLSAAVAGAAASQAGKAVSSNELEPGRYRILVAGLNQNILGAGVVAELTLAVAGDAAPGAYPVRLANVIMSDPSGGRVSATAEDGAIEVTGEAEGEAEGEAPPPGCQCAGAAPTRSSSAGGLSGVLVTGLLLVAASVPRRLFQRARHSA